MLKKFIAKAGNEVWINPVHVEAVGLIYSDGTEEGDDPLAKAQTYVLLRSGNSLTLDQKPEWVADQLSS